MLTETHLKPGDLNTTLAKNDTWDTYRLDQLPGGGRTLTGGVVLLVKKRLKLGVTLAKDFRDHHLAAATWHLSHAHWRHPFVLHAAYRCHAVSGSGPKGVELQRDTEDKQMDALQTMATDTFKSPGPAVLVGDFNLHLGSAQEDLVHPAVQKWKPRLSDHQPEGALKRLARRFMEIVNKESLLILNGRFGPESAHCTFERVTTSAHGSLKSHQTTIDYALCSQSLAPQIKKMRVLDNTTDFTDHSPVYIQIKCESSSEYATPAQGNDWWEDEKRELLDVSPFSWPDDDPDKQLLVASYQYQLSSRLVAPLEKLRALVSQWSACQSKRHLSPSRQPPKCPPACPCHHLQSHIDLTYKEIKQGTLDAAEFVLEVKSPATDNKRRCNTWKPDKEWYRLRAEQKKSWQSLQPLTRTSSEFAEARAQHKRACRALRCHTKEARAKWLSKRFSKVTLNGPSYVSRNAWADLKHCLGAEPSYGLPKQVITPDGKRLCEDESTKQWHKERQSIGVHDNDHPGFDARAQAARKATMSDLANTTAALLKKAPPPTPSADPMMGSISMAEVETMLSDTSSGTSPGPDKIPYPLMTNGGDFYKQVLLELYNLAWATGCHPSEWDAALIRPLYKPKTHDPLAIKNYRAVTLINCMCKGYESILFNRVASHLEGRRGIAPGQGARRHMGTEELLYTLTSAARDRHAHHGTGTYVCFVDFTLAYPSTDHSVIFTKMRDKAIHGRLWANIHALYGNMKSRVMHPGIAQDDFFPIASGVREGSVLSPILFIIAVDDMFDFLQAKPYADPSRGAASRQNLSGPEGASHNRGSRRAAPGLWISDVYLGLLQFVDDSALLATSPAELQFLIDRIAEYCALNRLSLNPKPGKTEVVEFMCEPSSFQYTVPTPTQDNANHRSKLRVNQGYRYLGWWLDKWLTLKPHVRETIAHIRAETAKVATMGGIPGGLPVQTAFQLWSALVLSHVHSAVSLIDLAQLEQIQTAVLESVQKLVGSSADPQAVLADLGQPDAITIRDLRVANLVNRLRTLPEYIVSAQLHRYLMSSPAARARGLEVQFLNLLHKYKGLTLWPLAPPPHDTLAKVLDDKGNLIDPIRRARSRFKQRWKSIVWDHRGSQMRACQPPYASHKFQKFAAIATLDLQRKPIWKCASYLRMEPRPKHHLALFQFRTQATLLADHLAAGPDDEEHDARCDGCETRLELLEKRLADARERDPPAEPATITQLETEIRDLRFLLSEDPAEDWEHAFFHCTKGNLPSARTVWHREMEALFTRFQPRHRGAASTSHHPMQTWAGFPSDLQLCSALGAPCPPDWSFPGRKPKDRRAKRDHFQQSVLQLCSAFALQICRVLREYKRAVAIDLEGGHHDWESVARTMEWGPDFSEPQSDDEADEASDTSSNNDL